MKPGDLRQWKKIRSERIFLVLKVSGPNGYCCVLERGEVESWSCLDVLSNSEAVNEAG